MNIALFVVTSDIFHLKFILTIFSIHSEFDLPKLKVTTDRFSVAMFGDQNSTACLAEVCRIKEAAAVVSAVFLKCCLLQLLGSMQNIT